MNQVSFLFGDTRATSGSEGDEVRVIGDRVLVRTREGGEMLWAQLVELTPAARPLKWINVSSPVPWGSGSALDVLRISLPYVILQHGGTTSNAGSGLREGP